MKKFSVLNNVKSLLEESRNGSPILQIQQMAVEMVKEITNSEGAYFHIFDENENAIDLAVWSESVHAYCHAEASKHYPLEEAGIWADCVRQKQAVIHNDYQAMPDSLKKGMPEDHFPVFRHMSVPVFSRDHIVSITGAGNKKKPYDKNDVENVQVLAELVWSITEQRKAELVIEKYAFEDALTGIANRRRYNSALQDEWNRHRRQQAEFSLAMFDIDFFKNYNDKVGHDNGDKILQTIAQTLHDSFRRSGEIVCRYGGEEFIVILPNTTKAEARKRADYGRKVVEDLKIPHPDSSIGPYVTVSGGVESIIPINDDYHFLEKSVDQNLYKAKEQGRNRIY